MLSLVFEYSPGKVLAKILIHGGRDGSTTFGEIVRTDADYWDWSVKDRRGDRHAHWASSLELAIEAIYDIFNKER
jgi:hypothetical protein